MWEVEGPFRGRGFSESFLAKAQGQGGIFVAEEEDFDCDERFGRSR